MTRGWAWPWESLTDPLTTDQEVLQHLHGKTAFFKLAAEGRSKQRWQGQRALNRDKPLAGPGLHVRTLMWR